METDRRCVDCRLTLATVYAARSDFSAAERELKEVLRQEPDNPFALNTLATVYLNLGRPAEAQPLAARAAEDENYIGRHLAYYNLGWALLQRQKYADALGAFQLALREAPRMCLAQYRIGEVFFHQGRYAEAVQHLRLAVEPQEEPVQYAVPRQEETRSCDQMADTHQLLGLALMAQGEEEAASAAFGRCVEVATPYSDLARRCAQQRQSQE